MSKRLRKSGSIFKTKAGRWRGYVTIGRSQDGKYIKRWASGATEKEVAEKLDLIRPVDVNNVLSKHHDITLSDWLKVFTQQRARSVRPKTTENHQNYNGHINLMLGGIRLRDLSKSQVQLLYNQLQDKGLGLSVRTHIHHFLKAALIEARDEGIINHLPLAKVPKEHVKTKSKSWTNNELKTYLKTAKSHSLYLLFYLLLDTGMRLGEALALRWKDYQHGQLSISRTLSMVGGHVTFNPPKTNRGYRTFLLSESTIVMFDKKKGQDEDLIFSTSKGTPYQPKNVRRVHLRLLELSKVTPIRIHDMRHTFITLAREKGLDAEVVASMVGQDVRVTLGIYSQVTDKRIEKARKQLGELFEDDDEE